MTRLLALVGLFAIPAWSWAQSARVGALAGSGGTVIGRVCLDLDRDDACGDAEPGIAGARLRFEDGRVATADEEGRFHVVDVEGRTHLDDRSAYGDHAVAADGLGVTRRFELAPRGTVALELAVPLDAGVAEAWTVAHRGAGSPSVAAAQVLWPLAGRATPGARVRAAGREVRARADGAWTLAVPLADGANAVGVVVGNEDGDAAVWIFEARVARPSSGAPRVYPSAPRRLAALRVRPLGDGATVTGVSSPGTALRLGGRPTRPAASGHFAAWVAIADDGLELEAELPGATEKIAIPVARGERPFRGILLGALELQLGGEAGFLASGRLAASIGGRWRGFDVDAGLDLDDRDRSALSATSPRDALAAARVPDPRRAFVVTGDHGAVEDRSPERGRAWAAVDGHGLRLDLGTTRASLGEGELGRYDRQLFGGRVRFERTLGPVRVDAGAFGAHVGGDGNGLAAGSPCQDRLAATGGSLYFLSRRDLVVGSERVRVEWLDPVSRLTVGTRELLRGRDYDLDAVAGRLLLTRPLSSARAMGALVGGDPFAAAEAWLVVDYLRIQLEDGARGVAGGELRGALGPVALGIGGAVESRPGSDWQVARASAALDLGAPLAARVEVARSEGLLYGGAGVGRGTSLDGGFSYGAPAPADLGGASAVDARLEGRVGPARWRGWWRERGAGYSDGTFEERLSARERGALAQGNVGSLALTLAWVEQRGADPRFPDGLARRDLSRAYGSAGLQVGRLDLALEALHERTLLPAEGSQSAAGLRGAFRAGRGLTIDAGHLQAFGFTGEVEERTFTSAGASLHAQEGTLGLHAGWGPDLGPRLLLSGERGVGDETLYGTMAITEPGRLLGGADGSAVGGRQPIHGGTLFTEERVGRDAWGAVAGRVVGASLSPADGLTLVLSAERGERWRGGETIARSAGGVAAALGRAAWKADARAEVRGEGGDRQWLAGLGAEWVATSRLTLSARGVAADGELLGRRARGGEGWLSAAWRADGLSLLARAGRVVDERTGVADREATIAAVAVTGRIARRARLGVGVDAAHQTVAGAQDDRLAGSLRGELAVVGPVDLAVEYARRGSLDGRDLGDLDAVRAEVGLAAGLMRLALGYTLVGFRGTGIDPEEEGDGRFYLRAVLAR